MQIIPTIVGIIIIVVASYVFIHRRDIKKEKSGHGFKGSFIDP